MKALICIIPFLLLFEKVVSQKNIYSASNTVFIEFMGYDTTLEYTSDNLFSQLSKEDTKLKFKLPLNTVRPVFNLKDRQVFESIFPPEQELVLYLTAEIPKSTFNLKELSEAKTYVLDGILSLFNQSVRTPVTLSMYYREGTVFFNLEVNFDLRVLEVAIPKKYTSIITGAIRMYVKEGVWEEFLLD